MIKALTGAEAVSEAMKQIEPDVVPVYPITPQTEIAQGYAQLVADGDVDSDIIRVESEHSAMSAAIGASAAGARAMTATSSAGLAYMWEMLGVASGLRLPIVMAVVNRALSAPINIHCDHSDSMGARDSSWIQIYSETAQEVYENMILALRLAEKTLLPVMIMQDGFITSHCLQKVKLIDSPKVKKFIGIYKPKNYLLDVDHPITMGSLELFDYHFETKYQQTLAMENAKKIYLEIGKELKKLTGNNYDFFEDYNLKDADVVLIALNSTAGTIKSVIDKLRKEKMKVGLLKPKLFRPFPYKEIADALKHAKKIAVLDRSESYGANPPLYSEIKNALYDLDKKPELHSFVYGLGGRDILESDIEEIFISLLKNKPIKQTHVGLR